jgi:hypothetical protein
MHTNIENNVGNVEIETDNNSRRGFLSFTKYGHFSNESFLIE